MLRDIDCIQNVLLLQHIRCETGCYIEARNSCSVRKWEAQSVVNSGTGLASSARQLVASSQPGMTMSCLLYLNTITAYRDWLAYGNNWSQFYVEVNVLYIVKFLLVTTDNLRTCQISLFSKVTSEPRFSPKTAQFLKQAVVMKFVAISFETTLKLYRKFSHLRGP